MLQNLIENVGLFLLGATYVAAPMAALAALNEIGVCLLVRRR